MSKVLPKEVSPLKFDTSSANIGCFIHTNTPPKCLAYDSYSTPFKTKKRARRARQRQMEFQDKAFLQSVVCKILNDADCKGITDLIDSMVFSGNSSREIENNQDTHSEISEQDEISQVFSDFQSFNKNSSPGRTSILANNWGLHRVILPQYHYANPSAQVNYEEKQGNTKFYTSILDSSAVSKRSESINADIQGDMGYSYGYMTTQNYLYQRHTSQRKRKSRTGQEVQEYKIYPERIEADGRTTLMVRHIPNKYTEEMLYEEIGRNHKLKINVLYLPVDHFNACNVGYAFVNFVHTKYIREFYREFNGRGWDRFNSQKICELTYGRIQGTINLMYHFQDSQLRRKTGPRVNQGKIYQECCWIPNN